MLSYHGKLVIYLQDNKNIDPITMTERPVSAIRALLMKHFLSIL